MIPPGETVLRAAALDLAYGASVVLRHVELTVRGGEFWFFLGDNGSGKTTFLRAVLGMLRPAGGSLLLDPRLGGRRGIGFVPQHFEVNPALPTTVRELGSLGLVGLAVPRRERAARLERALEQVGLGALARRDVRSLSGGQRQRALLARALVREPSLLVLDEPMSHLDADAQQALLADLVALNRSRALTVLLVTHDREMAERHATHVATFAGGRVAVRAAAGGRP